MGRFVIAAGTVIGQFLAIAGISYLFGNLIGYIAVRIRDRKRARVIVEGMLRGVRPVVIVAPKGQSISEAQAFVDQVFERIRRDQPKDKMWN